MIDLRIDSRAVVIELRGWSALWSFRRRIVIPLETIREVEPADRSLTRAGWKMLRAAGTFVPGVIIAGTYFGRDGRSFWYVRDFRRAVRIECEGGPYRRVVVEVDSIARVTEAIQSLRSGSSRSAQAASLS
jgi:hypothetical protein